MVLPVIDIFVAAYVMRNSQDVNLVVIYQFAVYTGIPLTLLINGFLLQRIQIKRLYSLGMLLSGVAMAVMMSRGKLTLAGIGVAGVLMGMAFGLFWANRDFLALSTTSDSARNYYYGVETFFYTNTPRSRKTTVKNGAEIDGKQRRRFRCSIRGLWLFAQGQAAPSGS